MLFNWLVYQYILENSDFLIFSMSGVDKLCFGQNFPELASIFILK